MNSAHQILIVDDEPLSAKVLRKSLDGIGNLHVATSGAEAIAIVAKHPIDLVLLDIIMPEMDGFEVCRVMQQDYPEIPVIFLTVDNNLNTEIRALRAGGQDFISKPINPPVVRARVALHLKLKAQKAEVLAANAALRESEERYRLLIDHSLDVIWTMNLDGEITYVSPSIENVLGHTPEEYLRMPPCKTYSVSSFDLVKETVDSAREKAKAGLPFVFQGELESYRKDGAIHWSEIKATTVYGKEGQFLEFFGVTRDVTERRTLEQQVRELNANLESKVAEQTRELRESNAVLRESEERYRMLFNHIADSIIILDLKGKLLAVNDQACRQYGYHRKDFLKLRITDIDAPADAVKPPGRSAMLDRQDQAPFESLHRDVRGRIIPVEVRSTTIVFDGQPAMMSLCRDITERKQAEQAIQQSRADLQRAQAMSHVGSWTYDLATKQTEWSDETYRIFGIEIGTPVSYELFLDYVHPEDLLSLQCGWHAATVGETVYDHSFRIIVAGEVKWLRNIVEFHFDERGNLRSMFGTQQDITEQKQAQARIEYLAYRDVLTGLANRALGQNRLLQELSIANRQQTHIALICLDLDRFKYVNDTYGHPLGDQLIKGVAQRLSENLRAGDVLCRLSGDEFMIVLVHRDAQPIAPWVASFCERILARIAEPFNLNGIQIFTSFSIGVAIYPQDGSDGETLMRNADTAMYEAKKAGLHNYRFFAPQMNANLIRFIRIRDALRLALDHGEFELHYQPQIDLHRRRVVGVEALIRWNRPGEGLTLPGQFIDVAEESGLIVPIGQWILREACRQAAAWCELGWKDFMVAVNLSAVQFRQGQLEQDVIAALEESGLAPANLELELTESILLENVEAVIDTLSQWKMRGIKLSIDDFGTGYSSLSYLKRFKVDKIKIDRSFITNLQTDEEHCAIVQAIIQIARSMNLRTIAEGVDNAALANQLKFIGCDEAQGYLYSNPLPAIELEEWLANFRNGTDTLGKPQPSSCGKGLGSAYAFL